MQTLGDVMDNTLGTHKSQAEEVVRGNACFAGKSTNGTVSNEAEFEINGAITDNWQMTFGATCYVAEDNGGNTVNPNLPRTTMNCSPTIVYLKTKKQKARLVS